MKVEVYEVRVYDEDETKYWYQNGKLHRLDGPAIEWSDGRKDWYQNGKLHRLDGPAIEWSDGRKDWYQNGKLHRLDGPAVEYANGKNRYRINDIEYSNEKDFKIAALEYQIQELKSQK